MMKVLATVLATMRWCTTLGVLWKLYSVFPYFFFKDASVTEKEDVFGLDGQIEHKLAFLRKHVPRGTNLLLIGHSIGCYIILEMMKRDPELKV